MWFKPNTIHRVMSEMYIWAHTGPETALVKTRSKFTFLEEFPFYNTLENTVKNVSQWVQTRRLDPTDIHCMDTKKSSVAQKEKN